MPLFNLFPGEKKDHPVLAPVSRSYPSLTGRLPTCYSPVRRSRQGASSHRFARLACIRHAASVRPEPGSNSHVRVYTSSFIKFVDDSFCSVFEEQTVSPLEATLI